MEVEKKCFTEEHKDINAISFCPECRIYMCNKCENLHSPLFKKHNPNKLKDIFDKIEKDKEDLKLKVQNIFTKIRNALNDREIQLLLEIDNIYNNKYFDENIIKKGEKLPKQIKLSIEKGKLIDKEWDNNNLYSYINVPLK